MIDERMTAEEAKAAVLVPMMYLYEDDAPGIAFIHPDFVKEEEEFGWLLCPWPIDSTRYDVLMPSRG